MTAGDRARPSPDPATRALRQQLLESDDDKARLRVLAALAQRKVFAPTWPSSPDAVRTLTNGEGEHAMPLFSAMDTLLLAAKRFAWGSSEDGTLCFRELAAQEVLHSALEHGVHCVVLDIYAEHSVEFTRSEISDALKKQRAAQEAAAKGQPARKAVARVGRIDRNSAPLGAGRQKRPGLAEIDAPFSNERTTGKLPTRAAIEEAAIRRKQNAARRIDPRVEPISSKPPRNPTPPPKRVARPRAETAPARPHLLRAPSTLREQPAPVTEGGRPPSGAYPQVDLVQASAPVQAPRAPRPTPGAFAQPDAESTRPSRPTSEEFAGLPDFPAAPAPQTSAQPQPPAQPNPPVRATPAAFPKPQDERAPRPTPGAFPRARIQPERAARPTPGAFAQPHAGRSARPTPEDLSQTVPDMPMVAPDDDAHAPPAFDYANEPIGLGYAAGEPEPQARPGALEAAAMVAQVAKLTDDESTQQAAAEVAAMLKDMARKGVVEEAKPSAAQSAAKAFAGLLSAELAADAQRAKRGKPAAAAAAAAAEPAPAAVEPVESESGLRPPEHVLADAVIEAISDALRRFPEVEWACEISDGSAEYVVGVRVDPSFLTRVKEIKATVLAAATSRKSSVSVLMLTDAQQMKDARTHGSAFFPWRRRAAKR